MRKVGDSVSVTDSTLGITFGLASEFLWGAAASAARVLQRVAECRIARRAEEFIDLDELLANASPDELAAMGYQRAWAEADGRDAPQVRVEDLADHITAIRRSCARRGMDLAEIDYETAVDLLADYRITKK